MTKDNLLVGPPLEEGSSWLSRCFMSYMDGLFAKGYHTTLELSDLGGINEDDKSAGLQKKFQKAWEEALESVKGTEKKPSMWGVLWRTIGLWRLGLALLYFLVSAAVQFGPVVILNALVKYMQGDLELTTAQAWLLVAALFIFPMISSITLAHSNAVMAHCGAQIRNTLIGAIYRKSLTLSPASRQEISTGRIVTMFSENTNQIRLFMYFVCNTIVAPIQIAVCLYLLYDQVGVSTFVGLGFMVCTIPINGLVFSKVNEMRKGKMTLTDSRVKLMNEVLDGIRIIKYYAWETAFNKKISAIRCKEVAVLERIGYVFNTAMGLLLLGASNIQIVLIFFTYIALGNQLDAATAFTAITLFGLMTSPLIFIPFGLQQYNTSLVSTGRIMEFLLTEDLVPYLEYHKKEDAIAVNGKGAPYAVVMENATISWHSKKHIETMTTPASVSASSTQTKLATEAAYQPVASGETAKQGVDAAGIELVDAPSASTATGVLDRNLYTLQDMTVRIAEGSLVAVVGAVGSGKSSFLASVLGEMYKTSGKMSIFRGTSYAFCDQRPWIVNATVRDNILFGSELNEQRLNAAIFAAAMTDDLKVLSHGLNTEIGERGINVSGGQKARIALARAVYSDADLYLMDDPLSAVDAHVGSHIFQRGIKEALRHKTRILVTHHVNVLPMCDHIIILEGGKIKVQGTYHEIVHSGIDIAQYVPAKEPSDDDDDEETNRNSGSVSVDRRSTRSGTRTGGSEKVRSRASTGGGRKRTMSGEVPLEAEEADDALIEAEETHEGGVTMKTYVSLIYRGGFWTFFFVMMMQFGSQLLNINAGFWLAAWGEETSVAEDNGSELSRHRTFAYFEGYAGMMIASVACMLFGRLALVAHRTTMSRTMHTLLLDQVLSSPVAFFDVTPIGRVINRFSQDMATVDEELSQSLSQVISMGGACAACIVGIIGATKGTFLVFIVPLLYLYSFIQKYYRASNTAIARIEAKSRSPIYADFSQVLAGTATVRSYKQEERYIKTLETYSDANTVPGVFQQITGQWLAIRLDFIGSFICFFCGALAVASKGTDFIPPGFLALGLAYSIPLTGLLKMAVRVSATAEAQMNSVERIEHYLGNLNREGDPGIKRRKMQHKEVLALKGVSEGSDIDTAATKTVEETPLVTPPAEWPSEGNISFKNVSMSYRDGPLVLKGVSFDVTGKQKIGFCGRTGCGKSSLMVALFRIEELNGGQIFIDGIDIATISMETLRAKLCIIPQDPVMFSASVRFNLDPFNLCSDTEVWDVLESVHMKDFIAGLPAKLEEMVSEGGSNFSAGQRQLICIARALLRKPKILVMDEATASIDMETDALVQRMIRDRFKDCTVLTIAHRLDTIFDSDKIAVMDKGLLKEFDNASELLKIGDGIFNQLWTRHQQEEGGKK